MSKKPALFCVLLFLILSEARAFQDSCSQLNAEGESEQAAQKPAEKPPANDRSQGWQFGGGLRSRLEWWDWFSPGAQAAGTENEYAFLGTYVRLTAARSFKRFDVFGEASVPLLFGLPKNATAPAPQGQLGLGPAYRAANGERVAFIFARQAFITIKGIGDKNTNLRLGRFEFIEGQESLTQDATLDWIKRERIAHRLIGNFAFSHVQRSADGVHLSRNSRGTNITVVAARPTVGVFEMNANRNISGMEYVYAGVTHTGTAKDFDARLLYIYYRDHRDVLKVDNRPVLMRQSDRSPIALSTAGMHYARKVRNADLLAWGAFQKGDWGVQSHNAWAWVVEAGYQLPKIPAKPWLRLGTNRTSGDRNSSDRKHESFIQILPTARIYARFPFFNMMNLEDDFLQGILRPHARVTIRADYRKLRLSQAADLWYSGGGAFQHDTFGFGGRPSGGNRALGNLGDISIEYRPASKMTLYFYYGYASGRRVIKSIYPAGSSASLTYWEISQRF